MEASFFSSLLQGIHNFDIGSMNIVTIIQPGEETGVPQALT